MGLYRPGSKNIKPNALSRQFQTGDYPSQYTKHPAPSPYPENRFFVSDSVHSEVLQWGLLQPLPVGLTFPWTLSLADHLQTVTQPLLLLIAFPKRPCSYPPAKKKFYCNMYMQLHGLPSDVVSDWGPQFTSHFWPEFCKGGYSQSFGFHPQANRYAEWLN